ncbi:MAG: insulinase family protein [Corallococcus sp.]|nr:insulinase family protein [Corallococcus sp.]
MEYSKTYKSGLRLVAKHMPSLYTVCLGIYVNVGSIREDKSVNGYSHFIEHLMFKGTTRRSAYQISEDMDNIGAQLNAFTSKDNTCFYTKSASTDLENCIDLLSDMYFNSQFDEKEIQREKNVVIEEINMGLDMPEDVCQDLIAEAAYFNQQLGQTIVGSAENIKYSDRHSILNFKEKYYVPSNTVISVAGNFDIDNLDTLIERYFENNFKSKYSAVNKEENSTFTAGKFLYKFKDTEQSHISLAYSGVSMENEEEARIFSLLSNILGGGMSSRLFQSIREKNGYAYSVYSFPSVYSNTGYLEIYCGTNPENLTDLTKLLQEELKKFVDEGITEAELARAKAQMTNGAYMGLENTMTVMTTYGRNMLKLNKVFDMEKRVAATQRISVEQVNALIRKIMGNGYSSCYVGKENNQFDLISKMRI